MTDQTDYYHDRPTTAVRLKQLAVSVLLFVLCLGAVFKLPDLIALVPQMLLRVLVVASFLVAFGMLAFDSDTANTIGRYMVSILAIATVFAALKWLVITAP